MKSNVTIRDARISDMESIHNLVMELAVFEKEPEAVNISVDYYKDQFQKGLFQSNVAELDGEIVGMTVFYPAFSTWKGKMMYLEDFVVKEAFRKVGIGQLLWNAFLSAAKAQDCKLIKWQVLDWNTSALKFYEKNGATIEKDWWNGKIIF